METQAIRAALLEAMDSVAPGCVPDEVDDDEDVREQMDLDSMDLLNIVAALHERLGVDVPEADMEELTTIHSAVAYLANRMS